MKIKIRISKEITMHNITRQLVRKTQLLLILFSTFVSSRWCGAQFQGKIQKELQDRKKLSERSAKTEAGALILPAVGKLGISKCEQI